MLLRYVREKKKLFLYRYIVKIAKPRSGRKCRYTTLYSIGFLIWAFSGQSCELTFHPLAQIPNERFMFSLKSSYFLARTFYGWVSSVSTINNFVVTLIKYSFAFYNSPSQIPTFCFREFYVILKLPRGVSVTARCCF
uniref:Uncharacterized protein n=1 Tax=Cacopsylla melanoneura TaxID=428564 RepID=A0A8D9ARF2_9HEMI